MPDTDNDLQFEFDGENLTIAFDNDLKPDDMSPETEDVEGYHCSKCGEFYPYAHANQEDGTFKCWGCRH